MAKFRAARRLWARIMRERFEARDPRSRMLRFHAQTAGSMLTAQQPENNIVRVAVQALAAVLGGCQSLHTNSMDEALSLPSEAAVRIALRTQQVLAHESGVADTVDPLGGAYSVERLTRDIEEEAEAYIAKIDGLGGSVHAIAVHAARDPGGGLPLPAGGGVASARGGGRQRVRHGRAAARRTSSRWTRASARRSPSASIACAGRGTPARPRGRWRRWIGPRADRDNLLPPILDAVRAQVTLGEICETLRGVFGVHQPSVVYLGVHGGPARRVGAGGRTARVPARRRPAGTADQVGATFGLMIQDVVAAFPPVEGPGGRGGGRPASTST